MPRHYDAFLSYRNRTDYSRARWVESFLESFHKKIEGAGKPVRPLQICRDGSDFRLPEKREQQSAEGVWPIIRKELENSEHLLVLCSPGTPASPWVSAEIEWFLEHQPDKILLAVTEASNPVEHPEECFPPRIRELGIDKSTIWYDLRGRDRLQRGAGVRDWEDEIVRLAADLLDWDAGKYGPLWSVFQREQLRSRRRQVSWIGAAAATVLVLAALAGWYALESNRAAQLARANAIVTAAQASSDPLTSALMLTELKGGEPQGGVAVARAVASQILPLSELRGPRSGIAFLQFLGADRVAAATTDGMLFLWQADGRADSLQSASSLGARPVDLAISPDGMEIATATREHKAMTWFPKKGTVLSYTIDGMIESVRYLEGAKAFYVVTEDGKMFMLGADGRVEDVPGGPPMAAVESLPGGGLLVASRQGDVWDQKAGTRVFRKRPGPPASIVAEVLASNPDLCRFSPNLAWYATAADHRILLRSTSDSKRFRILDYKKSIHALAYSTDSKMLAVGGEGGLVSVWDVNTGNQLQTFDSKIRFWIMSGGKPADAEPTSDAIDDLQFSPYDSDQLAVVTSDSVVRIWNMKGGNPVELHGHTGANKLAWNRDRRVLATGADVGTIRVWPLNPPGEPRILQYDSPVDQAFFMSDGRIVSRTRDQIVHEWDGVSRKLDAPGAGILAVDRATGSIYAGFAGGIVRRGGGKPLQWTQNFKLLDGAVSRLAAAKQLIVAASGSTLAVQNPDGAAVRLSSDGDDIEEADIRPGGDEFLTADKNGKVLIWSHIGGNWTSSILLPGDGKPVFEARYSSDGRQIVTCSENGSAFLFSTAAPRKPKKLNLPSAGKWLETCGFSPDSRWLLVTSETGQAWIARSDGLDPQPLRWKEGLAHVGSILSVSFNADASRVLLVGGVDGRATIWDVPTRRLLSELSGHLGAITTGGISPDGGQVMTASEDSSVRLWRNGWLGLLGYLRGQTTATLNPEQRIVLLGESESQALKRYSEAERAFGRVGSWPSPFQFPF